MADYCTLAEACSLLPGIPALRDAVAYSAGPPEVQAITATKPNATQGATILASVTAEIDMHLRGQGYETPTADPQVTASLRTIAMNGTAARIGKAMPSKDEDVVDNLREDYKDGLAFIDAGGLGPDLTSQGAGRVSHGFRDSDGVALSESTLAGRTTLETRF